MVIDPQNQDCINLYRKIIKITNYCDTFKVRVILTNLFSVNSNNLIIYFLNLPVTEMTNIINSWFIDPTLSHYNYDLNSFQKEVAYNQLRMINDWVIASNIIETPVIFIENIELSNIYNIEDIPIICEILQN